ncbi:MAG: hypothetical protein NVSMB49_12060 [Ktedonobacteraceae bacterium]
MEYSERIAAHPSSEEKQLLELQTEQPYVDVITVQADLEARTRLVDLIAAISDALIWKGALPAILQRCCEALVETLDVAFARIWTLDEQEQILLLQASAGLYTHLDGSHSRVPVGLFKIGLIAAERLPHLTNAVVGDPRVSDQEWAKREGMISFAGYPLLIEGRVVGVMAVFARHVLPPMTLDVMRAAAKAIALGIDHKQIEQEREQLLLTTQQARIQAEDALEARNTFLSSVSHDLKTPLTSIKGNAQMLQLRVKRGALSSLEDIARLQKGLETIESSVKKMRTMIDDLLDLAQLQAGQKLTFDTSEEDFVDLVRRVVQEQQATTRHTLTFKTDVSALPVAVDAVRVERVVGNLLNNATKYSPVGGEIIISLSQEHGEALNWAVLMMQDQGIGIPAADLPYIFEPFRRADNSRGKIQGTGIGLTSAAQIIEQHAGTISVESEEGVGTLFTIRLPMLAQE